MKRIHPHLRPLALVIALLATIISLYLSEAMHLIPCMLCWYQRIVMYPLVIIIAVGIFLNDKKLHFYALPLSFMGLVIAIYHNLLYYHIVSENLLPCSTGISCTTPQLNLFGFLTIPLMSLGAFLLLNSCLLFDTLLESKNDKAD